MAILQIPVANNLDAYSFSVILEQITYFFEFKYNGRRKRWLMDIYDQDKVPLIYGMPMLTNVDVLGQYSQEELPPGNFLVFDLSGLNKNPEQFDLGDTVLLLYEESESE